MALKITSKHLVLALAGLALALNAAAQWQWIDKDGRKVFSDRPPTSDIQEKDILKQPGRARVSLSPVETAEAATPAAAKAKASAPRLLSGKDTELESKKKKLEEEEAAKRKAEEEELAQNKAENCERIKRSLLTVQSGSRLSTTNAKGEREIMDETARATEIKRLQTMAEKDCK